MSSSRCISQSFWSDVLWLLWVETARNINEQQHSRQTAVAAAGAVASFTRSSQARAAAARAVFTWGMTPSGGCDGSIFNLGHHPSSRLGPGSRDSAARAICITPTTPHSSQLVNTSLNETSQLSALSAAHLISSVAKVVTFVLSYSYSCMVKNTWLAFKNAECWDQLWKKWEILWENNERGIFSVIPTS